MLDGPVDFLGCPIEEGDMVVYPVRRGSELYLRKMQILAIKKTLTVGPPKFKLVGVNQGGRQVIVERSERTIVVT